VCGPSFEYNDWINYIDRKGNFGKMKPFSNYTAGFVKLASAFGCLGVSIMIEAYLPRN